MVSSNPNENRWPYAYKELANMFDFQCTVRARVIVWATNIGPLPVTIHYRFSTFEGIGEDVTVQPFWAKQIHHGTESDDGIGLTVYGGGPTVKIYDNTVDIGRLFGEYDILADPNFATATGAAASKAPPFRRAYFQIYIKDSLSASNAIYTRFTMQVVFDSIFYNPKANVFNQTEDVNDNWDDAGGLEGQPDFGNYLFDDSTNEVIYPGVG